ncbi:hypothetical protein [Rhodohalobacter sp. 8-1]|uniref:hypothetical protein n=1 Tax=Rhodohalobacter sp. 8-1 TaxID=3131972 RepID=UPI0030ED1CBF
MNEEQLNYYKKMTEKIFSIPANERGNYLAEIKKKDGEFYERIEHLSQFLLSRKENVEKHAQDQIKRILSDLNEDTVQ